MSVWQPVDCHAHTTCSDGSLEMSELVVRVSARGVLDAPLALARAVGVNDDALFDPWRDARRR